MEDLHCLGDRLMKDFDRSIRGAEGLRVVTSCQQAILVVFGLPLLKYWRDDNKTAANDRSEAAGGRYSTRPDLFSHMRDRESRPTG